MRLIIMSSWVVGPLTSANLKTGNINSSNLNASQIVATDGSKNLISVSTTGSGNVVLATSPTLVTPVLGNATATTVVVNNGTNAVTLTAVGATSNWNFAFPAGHGGTGDVLTSANGGVLTWTPSIGSGNNVLATSPTLVTPVLGNATATTVVVNNGTNAITLTAVGATSNWNFAFPASHGATNSVLTSTNGGVMNWTATTGTGNNVFDTNPTFSADITVGGYYHGTGGVIGLGGFSSDGSTYFGYGVGGWTPTLIMAYQTGETKTFSIGYNTQYGRYEKIGSQVTVYFYLSAYISASVGQVPSPSFFNIGGLPYPANDSVHTYFDFVIDPTKDTSLYALTGAPGVPTSYYPGPFTFEVNENGYTETLVLNPLGVTPTNVGTYTYDGTVMAVWGLQTNDIISGDIVENTLHIPTNNVVSGGINYQVVFAGSGSYISN
jgi:hypothetical protein